MKIAIYSHEIPSSTFIENIVEGMADRGFTVYLFGKKNSPKQYGKNVVVKGCPSTRTASLLFVVWQSVKLLLKRPGLLMHTYRQVFSARSEGHRLTKLCYFLPILNHPVDVFHFQWGNDLTFHRELFNLLRCRIFLSVRGSHFTYAPAFRPSLAKAYRDLFPLIHRFHAVSDTMSNKAIGFGARPGQVQRIYSGLTPHVLSRYRPWQARQAGSALRIISVGRFHWVKGYLYALEAMACLVKMGVDVHYTVVAQGKQPEDFKFALHTLGLLHRVTVVNGLPHPEVLSQMGVHHAVLCSSVAEGLSNVVLEAMALGVPVVSTDCGGMSEVIAHGETGLLVPVRNPEAIAAALKQIAEMNSEQLAGMTAAAHQKVKQQHNLHVMLDAFQDFYTRP